MSSRSWHSQLQPGTLVSFCDGTGSRGQVRNLYLPCAYRVLIVCSHVLIVGSHVLIVWMLPRAVLCGTSAREQRKCVRAPPPRGKTGHLCYGGGPPGSMGPPHCHMCPAGSLGCSRRSVRHSHRFPRTRPSPWSHPEAQVGSSTPERKRPRVGCGSGIRPIGSVRCGRTRVNSYAA